MSLLPLLLCCLISSAVPCGMPDLSGGEKLSEQYPHCAAEIAPKALKQNFRKSLSFQKGFGSLGGYIENLSRKRPSRKICAYGGRADCGVIPTVCLFVISLKAEKRLSWNAALPPTPVSSHRHFYGKSFMLLCRLEQAFCWTLFPAAGLRLPPRTIGAMRVLELKKTLYSTKCPKRPSHGLRNCIRSKSAFLFEW